MEIRARSRSWLGKEKLRQAELRLGAQATSLAALEGRANMLVGLCAAGIAATTAVAFGVGEIKLKIAAASTGILLLIAGSRLMFAIAPKENWGVPGFSPSNLDIFRNRTEDISLSDCANVLEQSISDNTVRLRSFGRTIRHASWKILLAPSIGALISIF